MRDLAGKAGVVEITVDALPNGNANEYARNNYTLEAVALFNRDDLSSADMSAMEERLEEVPGFFIPDAVRDMLKQGGWQMMPVNSGYETASDEAAQQPSRITSIVKTCDPDALITGESAMTEDLRTTSAGAPKSRGRRSRPG